MSHQFCFFLERERLEGDFYLLSGEEFRHCCKVLRKNQGEQIILRDGKCAEYMGTITEIGKDKALIRIQERQEVEPAIIPVHLAVGLLKRQKLEYLIHRVVELGIKSIALIRMRYSVRTDIRLARLERIAVEAMKQSNGYFLPRIEYYRSLQEWLSFVKREGIKLLADQEGKDDLKSFLVTAGKGAEIYALVGPEGGVSPEEMEMAREYGFSAVRINPRRLMSETAAIALVAMIYAMVKMES